MELLASPMMLVTSDADTLAAGTTTTTHLHHHNYIIGRCGGQGATSGRLVICGSGRRRSQCRNAVIWITAMLLSVFGGAANVMCGEFNILLLSIYMYITGCSIWFVISHDLCDSSRIKVTFDMIRWISGVCCLGLVF